MYTSRFMCKYTHIYCGFYKQKCNACILCRDFFSKIITMTSRQLPECFYDFSSNMQCVIILLWPNRYKLRYFFRSIEFVGVAHQVYSILNFMQKTIYLISSSARRNTISRTLNIRFTLKFKYTIAIISFRIFVYEI